MGTIAIWYFPLDMAEKEECNGEAHQRDKKDMVVMASVSGLLALENCQTTGITLIGVTWKEKHFDVRHLVRWRV